MTPEWIDGPAPTPLTGKGALGFGLIAAAAIIAAHALDHWAYPALLNEGLATDDLGRLFRVMGFVPTWLAAGAALVLCDWPVRRRIGKGAAWARGALIGLAPAVAGLAAETLKILIRRQRPAASPGEYSFRPWSERRWSSGGLGMPSSHSLVAFGAAAILARLFPRAKVVWYGLAIGCGYSRIAAGAHFVSDVVAAWVVAEVVIEWMWRRYGRWARIIVRVPA